MPIRNDAQVFDEAERRLNAVLAIQPGTEQLTILLDVVQDGVRVDLIASGKRDELVRLAELTEML